MVRKRECPLERIEQWRVQKYETTGCIHGIIKKAGAPGM